MREIKFRGYDLDSKCWRYGYYFLKEDITLCVIYDSKEQREEDKKKNEHHLILWNDFSDWNMSKPHYQSEVDGKSVGQFTGLYDKNGKWIYEGDIVKFDKNCCRGYGVIKNGEYYSCCESCREYGDLGFLGFYIETKYKTCDICEQLGISSDIYIEVIGNIYENAELLENKQL